MTPQDRQLIVDMQKEIAELQLILRSFLSGAELDPQIQRTIAQIVTRAIGEASINDFADVDITSPTNGQVLKYTTTGDDRWINAADDIGVS
jgi:hypothetical protein